MRSIWDDILAGYQISELQILELTGFQQSTEVGNSKKRHTECHDDVDSSPCSGCK